MLILMNQNTNNQRSAEFLQSNHLGSDDQSHCFVIDIEQQFFKKNITPEQFVTQLLESGLPDSIQDIYLLTSEIEQNHFLAVFAHYLSRIFAEHHRRMINVHVPTYLSCEMTLIVPSAENNHWKIYGINRSEVEQNDLSYENILAAKNKKMIWEGNNLLDWMNDPQQTYNGRTYTWENQQ